jgi:hypothetical protein
MTTNIECVISFQGIAPDATIADLDTQFSIAGIVEHLLPIREAHSNLCTGRGYVIYSEKKEAEEAVTKLNGLSFRGDDNYKLIITAASKPRLAEITTLIGKFRLSQLNIPSIIGQGSNFIDQLIIELDSLSDPEMIQLFAKIKTKRGPGILLNTDKTTVVTSPKLPSFTGSKDKSDVGYAKWRFQLQTLLSDGSYTDSQIFQTINQSVKDTAGSLLLSMPSNSSCKDVLDTFDKYFGNVFDVDTLTQQFHSSKQETKENVVMWSCRLQRMLDMINQKKPMIRQEYELKLRSKFYHGLRVKDIKTGCRHRYDNGEEFLEILAAARSLECEESSTKEIVSQQVAAGSKSDESSKHDKVLERLSSLEKQMAQLHAAGLSNRMNSNPSATNHSTTNDSTFCTRCKRITHTIDKCHAKKDKYGKLLKN